MSQIGTASKRIEARCYELLGVKQFRKLLFWIEARKHRKDGGKNANYHLRDASIYSMESYHGYILYNTGLHVISILFAASYFLITWLIGRSYPVLTVLMCLILVFNCYCIMLQRYVYLKIQSHSARRKARLAKKEASLYQTIKEQLGAYDESTLLSDYENLCRIKEKIAADAECFLDDRDAELLRKLGSIIRKPDQNPAQRAAAEDCSEQVGQLISAFPDRPAVVLGIERRVSALQKMQKKNHAGNVLYGYTIVTLSESCEKEYKRLFPNSDREEIEAVFGAAARAYEHVLAHIEGGSCANGHDQSERLGLQKETMV